MLKVVLLILTLVIGVLLGLNFLGVLPRPALNQVENWFQVVAVLLTDPCFCCAFCLSLCSVLVFLENNEKNKQAFLDKIQKSNLKMGAAQSYAYGWRGSKLEVFFPPEREEAKKRHN